MANNYSRSYSGFTLIELLIVIAVLGVLAGGVLVTLNITGIINKTKMAKVETFDASIQKSLAIDLVGEWTFDGNANDISGYGNNGTVTGATLTTDRKETASKAYSFNGISDNINVGTNSSLQVTRYTISAWVNPAATKNAGIFSKQTNANDGYYLVIRSTGKITAGFVKTAVAEVSENSVSSYSLNTWAHVLATWDGTRINIYINGSLDKKGGDSSAWSITQSSANGLIGNHIGTYSGFFNGSIDDIRVYNRALLSSQIQQLYAQGLPRHQLAKR